MLNKGNKVPIDLVGYYEEIKAIKTKIKLRKLRVLYKISIATIKNFNEILNEKP